MKDYFWCGNAVCGFHGERKCENQDGTSVAVCPLCGERATVIIGARTPPPQYVALRAEPIVMKEGWAEYRVRPEDGVKFVPNT